MKKSMAGDQTLTMNRIDFERAGSGRKAGYKFLIELVQGRVANVISGSPLASDLAMVLLQDAPSRAILQNNDFNISLNTKFQLFIHHVAQPGTLTPEEQPSEVEKTSAE